MDLFTVLLLAVALAMDAMAVSLGIGTTQYAVGRRPLFRLSFHFGLFQALMPVVGWLAGTSVERWISAFDHWVALALLAFVGLRMIRSGLGTDGESHSGDPSRGRMLILLSVAVSIDALAVGLSLAIMGVNIVAPAIIIGVVTAGLSLLALRIGHRVSDIFGKRMEIVGGLILIAIGLRIVISHLTA